MFQLKNAKYSLFSYGFGVCVIISLSNSVTGNTYDIPRWLRVNPDELQCPEPVGQFSHPRYCDLFLNCWDGRPVVGKCQEGLVFNEKYKYCDYKHNVNCGGKPSSQEFQEPPSDPNCPTDSGTFPYPEDCSYFVVCHRGMSTLHKCPQMQYFHAIRKVCGFEIPPECSQMKPTSRPLPTQQPPSPIITGNPATTPTPVTTTLTTQPPSTGSFPEISEPLPEITAGGTPTRPPTSARPQAPFRPEPQPEPGVIPPFEETTTTPTDPTLPFTPKPPFLPNTPPPSSSPPLTNPPQEGIHQKPPFVPDHNQPSSVLQPDENPPQGELSPKPPFVPEKPPVAEPSPTEPNFPQVDFSPKPPFFPEPPPRPEPVTPKPTSPPVGTEWVPKPSQIPEESNVSQPPTPAPSSPKPPTVSNLKPKPPLEPKPEEVSKPPLINLGNLTKPPPTGPSPVDPLPSRPPTLNPDLFKPQTPPSHQPVITTSPHPPVDGEDDPNILFPFLPKFPDLFKCPVDTVMLPVLGDCSSLIACIAGVGQRLVCPDRTMFDPREGKCTSRAISCPSAIPSFISEMDKNSVADVIYAYLPVAKFSQLLNIKMS